MTPELAAEMKDLVENLALGWWHEEETRGWPASLVKKYRADARALIAKIEGEATP